MYHGTIGPDSKSGKEAAHKVTRAAKRSKISHSQSVTTIQRKWKEARADERGPAQNRTHLQRGKGPAPLAARGILRAMCRKWRCFWAGPRETEIGYRGSVTALTAGEQT